MFKDFILITPGVNSSFGSCVLCDILAKTTHIEKHPKICLKGNIATGVDYNSMSNSVIYRAKNAL